MAWREHKPCARFLEFDGGDMQMTKLNYNLLQNHMVTW